MIWGKGEGADKDLPPLIEWTGQWCTWTVAWFHAYAVSRSSPAGNSAPDTVCPHWWLWRFDRRSGCRSGGSANARCPCRSNSHPGHLPPGRSPGNSATHLISRGESWLTLKCDNNNIIIIIICFSIFSVNDSVNFPEQNFIFIYSIFH